ncbi:MAG: class I SAM-dependent methyltransferase [Planctomycetota bacterium]
MTATASRSERTRAKATEPAARRQSIDWYDLPRYYDIVFDEGTKSEATFLERMLEQYGVARTRRVLEPACGSGRLVAELAARGHSVTGFDKNRAMLAFAAQRLAARGLHARLVEADLARFSFRERFDLAHCLVSTFKYLTTEDGARAHLRAVARALAPRGVYVLGLHLTDYGSQRRSRERWVARRGGTSVTCNTQVWPANRKARLEPVRTRLSVRTRAREARYETEWSFRTYDARELRALIASVSALEHVATYDFTYGQERQLSDDQLDCVLVLRKRK